MSYDYLAAEAPQIADAIGQELSRQRSTIELIASENIASLAVMQAMGTVLTNKYAEGYSGKRYYGGNRARLQAVRLQVCQRAASFWR